MPRTGIIFDACFNQEGDDGKLYGFFWHQNPPQVVASGSQGISCREGTHYMECYLHRTESSYAYRTMGIFNADDDAEPDAQNPFKFAFGVEYWVGMSIHLQDWVSDSLSSVLWQCQATPDSGELYRQPCLSIIIKNNEWGIKSRWDTRAFSPPSDGTFWPHSEWLYQADATGDINTWVDWVFHIIWSHTSSGLVQVWKNGILVAERSGPNCSNDVIGPYPSAGIYEWSWREEYWSKYSYETAWRRLWFDSVRIGDNTSSYEDVAPAGAPAPPPPDPPPAVSARRTIGTSLYKLRLKSAAGVLVAEVTDFGALCYDKHVNHPGLCTFNLDGDHAAIALLEHKSQVEVWRANPCQGLDWHCDFYALYLRPDHFQRERHVFTATCPGQMWFLNTRIVAWYAQTVNRTKFTGVPAETIMKTLVSYNACANATIGNGRERNGAITGLGIQADGAAGNSLDWYCAWKNLLTELQDLAQVAGGDFDLIKTAAQAWEFRWYTGQRGADRRSTVIFARERGNMANPHYHHDRISEKTVAIVGGQGETDERDIVIRTGDDYSAGNDVEIFVDARKYSVTAGYNAAGDKRLSELRAREEFTWEAVQSPACFYGQVASGGDYELGDLVTARAFDIEKEHKIIGVTVTVVPAADTYETIDIEIETPVTAP